MVRVDSYPLHDRLDVMVEVWRVSQETWGEKYDIVFKEEGEEIGRIRGFEVLHRGWIGPAGYSDRTVIRQMLATSFSSDHWQSNGQIRKDAHEVAAAIFRRLMVRCS